MFMFIGCLEIVLLVILVCPEGVSAYVIVGKEFNIS